MDELAVVSAAKQWSDDVFREQLAMVQGRERASSYQVQWMRGNAPQSETEFFVCVIIRYKIAPLLSFAVYIIVLILKNKYINQPNS